MNVTIKEAFPNIVTSLLHVFFNICISWTFDMKSAIWYLGYVSHFFSKNNFLMIVHPMAPVTCGFLFCFMAGEHFVFIFTSRQAFVLFAVWGAHPPFLCWCVRVHYFHIHHGIQIVSNIRYFITLPPLCVCVSMCTPIESRGGHWWYSVSSLSILFPWDRVHWSWW